MGKIIWTLVAVIPLIILADYLTQQPPQPPASTTAPVSEQAAEPLVDEERQRLLGKLSQVKKEVAEQESEIFLEEAQKQAQEENAQRLSPDEPFSRTPGGIRPKGWLRASSYVCSSESRFNSLAEAFKTNDRDAITAITHRGCEQTRARARADILTWDPTGKKAEVITGLDGRLWTGTWNVDLD